MNKTKDRAGWRTIALTVVMCALLTTILWGIVTTEVDDVVLQKDTIYCIDDSTFAKNLSPDELRRIKNILIKNWDDTTITWIHLGEDNGVY